MDEIGEYIKTALDPASHLLIIIIGEDKWKRPEFILNGSKMRLKQLFELIMILFTRRENSDDKLLRREMLSCGSHDASRLTD
jgi:hypothetical protein